MSGVSANAAYSTPTGFAIQNAGTYYWVASFSGDSNNKQINPSGNDCNTEPVAVGSRRRPPVTSAVALGRSSLAGHGQGHGDVVGGQIWLELGRARSASGSWRAEGVQRGGRRHEEFGEKGSRRRSISATPPAPRHLNSRTYYWVASFSGDSNNKQASTGCNDAPAAVGKSSPSLVTSQQPASGAIGDTYKDTATLSGATGPWTGRGRSRSRSMGRRGATGGLLPTPRR